MLPKNEPLQAHNRIVRNEDTCMRTANERKKEQNLLFTAFTINFYKWRQLLSWQV